MTRTSYHHGALRDTLLAACLRLIETEGIGAVSLRRVAREAGVNTGAPYHHFVDRAALLAALSTQGFQLLGNEVTAARAAADTPLHALTALAETYVRFSREHPGHFRLMFRPELSQPDKHPDAMDAGDDAFTVLADTVADCVAAGLLPADKADTIAVAWWGSPTVSPRCGSTGNWKSARSSSAPRPPALVDDILRTFTAPIALIA
ncbi:TetR/AcrR family transcriptional regulator [Nocardia sp. NPDC051463]|uniref:TetR/AcrR family transcriptional regulator n=1 Tax=Nocardia sp. NPDC051463 TaxID=3154845 RepID=UPI0034143E56